MGLPGELRSGIVRPRPPAPPAPDPCLSGPYDPANGADAYGHPVNGCGRCEGINADPPTCPPPDAP
jgi:hypothetical protein